jgi:hypothetical protein
VKRAIFLLWAVLLAGCVERKLIVKPEPKEALVFVDGAAVATVASESVYRYEHYGIHRVVVRRPGCEVKEQLVTLDPPWYQVFPIDFFFDVLWPGTIEDRREVAISLERRQDLQGARPGKAVIERAHDFAEEAKKP